tara:strand:+ start:98 stop:394 length:297 start_codon:yes stop_codon:yes gene_type:complete
MKLDEKMVDKIAELSKLEFKDEEKATIINDMNKMLDFVDQLQELNTDNVEPLIHMSEEFNVLREDENVKTINQDEALKNAPSKDSTYFKIPKVLDKKA